eukprot:CAMPEP_0113234800 /NCGR_PEP_ID=MMETSP0008_2-20120614/3219_1 /TAXON_ID=97485 /ORGANISM="Prymnesium parvum" /LENGTH=81 /DNA_ID=CAMNT_0000081691 /DNA_START=241 /DNA_END=486 /DNA_ORIENTATION=- /assembly_acc=CAM_ASM_000153
MEPNRRRLSLEEGAQVSHEIGSLCRQQWDEQQRRSGGSENQCTLRREGGACERLRVGEQVGRQRVHRMQEARIAACQCEGV